MRYEHREGVSGSTVLTLPAARIYPDGWTATLEVDGEPDEGATFDWDEAKGTLSLTPGKTGSIFSVEVRPDA